VNIRKNVDYSAMYAQIDIAMQAELPQMERYFAIGQAVVDRPEKGAAVAAAEYIQKNWPDEKGYSPRNVRRMRDLYRVYGNCTEAIKLAEQVGWTQNVAILEAELDLNLRLWYMRAAKQFGWSKYELLVMIQNEAHMEIVLDNGQEVCVNEINENKTKIISQKMIVVKFFSSKLFWLIRQRCRGKPKIGGARWPIMLCPIPTAKRIVSVRCWRRSNSQRMIC